MICIDKMVGIQKEDALLPSLRFMAKAKMFQSYSISNPTATKSKAVSWSSVPFGVTKCATVL